MRSISWLKEQRRVSILSPTDLGSGWTFMPVDEGILNLVALASIDRRYCKWRGPLGSGVTRNSNLGASAWGAKKTLVGGGVGHFGSSKSHLYNVHVTGNFRCNGKLVLHPSPPHASSVNQIDGHLWQNFNVKFQECRMSIDFNNHLDFCDRLHASLSNVSKAALRAAINNALSLQLYTMLLAGIAGPHKPLIVQTLERKKYLSEIWIWISLECISARALYHEMKPLEGGAYIVSLYIVLPKCRKFSVGESVLPQHHDWGGEYPCPFRHRHWFWESSICQ